MLDQGNLEIDIILSSQSQVDIGQSAGRLSIDFLIRNLGFLITINSFNKKPLFLIKDLGREGFPGG